MVETQNASKSSKDYSEQTPKCICHVVIQFNQNDLSFMWHPLHAANTPYVRRSSTRCPMSTVIYVLASGRTKEYHSPIRFGSFANISARARPIHCFSTLKYMTQSVRSPPKIMKSLHVMHVNVGCILQIHVDGAVAIAGARVVDRWIKEFIGCQLEFSWIFVALTAAPATHPRLLQISFEH